MKKIDEPNWGMIGFHALGLAFWIGVWFYGFFLPVMALVIGSAIVGIWMKVTGRM